ncbi:MAG: hypothetical protein IIA45_03035 [Bacteroidetes bacterium]|nr:hypothetical protein [Bacteroidota bacterium]
MKAKVWNACIIMAIVISIIAFTPVVIPEKIAAPFLYGLPRTLWVGLLISLLFIGLTVVGYFVSPDDPNQEKND